MKWNQETKQLTRIIICQEAKNQIDQDQKTNLPISIKDIHLNILLKSPESIKEVKGKVCFSLQLLYCTPSKFIFSLVRQHIFKDNSMINIFFIICVILATLLKGLLQEFFFCVLKECHQETLFPKS